MATGLVDFGLGLGLVRRDNTSSLDGGVLGLFSFFSARWGVPFLVFRPIILDSSEETDGDVSDSEPKKRKKRDNKSHIWLACHEGFDAASAFLLLLLCFPAFFLLFLFLVHIFVFILFFYVFLFVVRK